MGSTSFFPKESTPEDEEKMIEKAVELISSNDIEDIALIFLGTFRPGVYIIGEMSRVFLAPLLVFTGDKGYDILNTFEKRENVDKLVKKIEQVRKEKDEKSKLLKKEKGESLYSRIKKKIQRFFK